MHTYPCEPEVVTLALNRGEEVHYDVNARRLLGDRDAPATARPNFPRRVPASIGKLVLEATHHCNLQCTYCFVREQYFDERTMTLATAQQAFTELLPRDRDVAVTFFGGEPLLAWHMIREFVPWARGVCQERGRKVRFHLTTNGTLITAERAAFLARYGFSLIVSLDGPPAVHNASRPTGTPEDSHALTLAGLQRAGKAGLGRRTTLRATYAAAELRADDHWLVERLDYFHGLIRAGLASNVSIEPAWASCADVACVRAEGDAAYVEQLEPAYWRAAEWIVRERKRSRPGRLFHFDKYLERVLNRTPQPSECGAGFGAVAVSPGGTICACHRETGTAIGRLGDGVDEAARAPWLDNRLYARRGCDACWARGLCGGGCRMDSLLHLGDVHEPCPWECAFKRMLIRIALWMDRELANA